ncbi:MAG TPA: ABC transporter ATP-binding protein [Enteractinococcus helveticum]|uniref:ABC transporter ATP-binding protein n=1 Tax=Enteractinococcus helveticum TaxID=1837282 RepID=A0A921FNK5_9MICC|nr:ABC transporter ATP-binding protein [Enteractinococcus helveticum]HJF14592.1 ABC transporter ATP-binding protein [Enteractinococcus helveticum]
MLKLKNINKTFFPNSINERVALSGINLELDDGDFVTVIGSNGAGKSTVLNTIAGKVSPDTGIVEIAGRNVTRMKDFKRAKYVGRVFQDPMAGTSPDLTIEQNMALAERRGQRRGLSFGITKAKRQRFAEALEVLELGLEKRLSAKVGLLSGGQRQALSLLMATFSQPKILLLDEHTAALDPERARLVTHLTEKVVAEQKLTTLMVTHNMSQALEVGNRLIMMHEGEIILDVSDKDKASMTVEDLLAQFSNIKDATVSDRTLLQ